MSFEIGDYFDWFKQQYKNFNFNIKLPASFTVIIPSKDMAGKEIPSSEIEGIIYLIKSAFIRRFKGLTIIQGKGYWSGGSGGQIEEDVQIVEVNGAFLKEEIYSSIYLLVSIGLKILKSLHQEEVMVKLLEYPILIRRAGNESNVRS